MIRLEHDKDLALMLITKADVLLRCGLKYKDDEIKFNDDEDKLPN